MTAPIRFLKLKDPHGHMSNFWPSSISWSGKLWPTSEHLYQAQKHRLDSSYQEVIRLNPSPWAAAKLGRDQSHPMVLNWDDIKEDCMLTCLFLKYTQHPSLKSQLLATGTATLIEASDKDSYWAEGPDGKGLNRLGCLLMETRAVLRNTENVGHYIDQISQLCGMYL